MRLTNYFLFENEEEDNKKRIYTPQEYFIATKETPIEQVKDALDDLNNYKDAGYGQYVTYQRQADPSINPIIQKAFGPGGGPNMKIPANRKEWNSAGTEWRLKKAKDIQSRTGLDITGWEDLSYDQLPKEATDWKVFYPQSSIEAMIPIILDITQKSDILKWVEKNGLITFPKPDNKTVPNDETLEKVLKTVMKNAGIKDFIISKQDADTKEKPKSKSKEKEVPSISSYDILKNPNGSTLTAEDAEDLKDDLESKISELKPEQSDLKVKVVLSKQDPNNAILRISGFKSNKERGNIQQKVQDYLNNLSERKLKRNFQVRAGIIK